MVDVGNKSSIFVALAGVKFSEGSTYAREF